jgi:hypothetical protein
MLQKEHLETFGGEHLGKNVAKVAKRAGKGAVAAGLLIFHYPPKIKNTSLALSWHCRNANATGPTTNHNITAASERAAKIGGEYLRNVMQQCSEGASNRAPVNGRIINNLPKLALYHSLSSSIVDNQPIERAASGDSELYLHAYQDCAADQVTNQRDCPQCKPPKKPCTPSQ